MIQQDDMSFPTPFRYDMVNSNVNVDNQLAEVLSHFSYDYIASVIDESLQNRLRLYDMPAPNIIGGYEITFQKLSDGFSSNSDEIIRTRLDTYKNIIDKICNFYDLEFSDESEMDYYLVAYYLYDFLISNFTQGLVKFYTLYIINERNSLYLNTELDKKVSDMKKSESDGAFKYSKRLFQDPKLAAIHSNIEYVIYNMATFDISIYDILNTVYLNRDCVQYISGAVTDRGNFFRTHYNSFLQDPKYNASLIIAIKLELQNLGKYISGEV